MSRALYVYRLRATALCPADGLRDHYDVELRSDRMLQAEHLRKFFESLATEHIFQEDLSAAAAKAFDAEVTITGDHPSPIRIESGGSS